MGTIFPSNELCSQRGVKWQYGLFIIRTPRLTKSGAVHYGKEEEEEVDPIQAI